MTRIFYGWWIVGVAALGLFLGAGSIIVYSFSVFLIPLARDFHSTRGAISFAYTLFAFAAAPGALIMGRLIDRFGVRIVTIFSLTTCALLLLSNALFFGKIWHLYSFYFLLGLVGIGTSPLPYSDLISHWFDRRRGLALGLMMLGLGASAIIMPPLMQRLITTVGWRAAYELYGAAVLVIAVPLLALFLKERPESMGLFPDGDNAPRAIVHANYSDQGLAWREVRNDRAFWYMLSAFFLLVVGLQGCLVHLPAMLVGRGSTPQTAAWAASLFGAAVLIGRPSIGYLLDRFFAPYVAAFFFAQAALGIALLALNGPPWLPFVSAISVGFGLGAEGDVMAYMVSRYFGLRSFAEIYSYLWCGFVVAVGAGPYLMGLGFDKTGSYLVPLVAFAAAGCAAAVLIARLGPYRFSPRASVPAAVGSQPEVA